MTDKGYVIPAAEEHIEVIAHNMRAPDVREVRAVGHEPLDALRMSHHTSSLSWTAVIGGAPSIMFGVSPVCALTGLGGPWMLGTDGIYQVRRQFIRECRGYVDQMMNLYPRLVNYTDVRNEVSIRWLKWLGFTFAPAISIGVNGEMFFPFMKGF